MTTNGTISDRTPLSVLLFNEAMERRKSVSEFAEEIEVGAISLRQFISNKTQRPRTKTIEQISVALGMPVEEVRRRMELLPEATPSLGDWLRQHMTGRYTRASLAKETKISDGALKNYLSGQTLPDSEQAARLVDALGVTSLDLARVVVANQVAKEGGAVAPPEEPADSAADAGEPGAGGEDAATPAGGRGQDDDQLLGLWRRLHPQGRRATIHYIAGLLAEG
jgi:transcriptional regulator with XRE-family HTH domain/DNA-binding phage protein